MIVQVVELVRAAEYDQVLAFVPDSRTVPVDRLGLVQSGLGRGYLLILRVLRTVENRLDWKREENGLDRHDAQVLSFGLAQ